MWVLYLKSHEVPVFEMFSKDLTKFATFQDGGETHNSDLVPSSLCEILHYSAPDYIADVSRCMFFFQLYKPVLKDRLYLYPLSNIHNTFINACRG